MTGEVAVPKTLYRGKGCAVCGMTGYVGRLGIFEVLEVTDAVKKTIDSEHFNIDALRAEARRNGMITMFEDGLRKVELAETTIDEVLRVIRE
jgi:type II secretory ATPase GspE/PulE/Tfp pilus assembly ATPase PilB-like protein